MDNNLAWGLEPFTQLGKHFIYEPLATTRRLIDAGSSSCSLSVLLSAVETSRRTLVLAWWLLYAFLGRNRTLFQCVFQSCYCIRSAVVQNFCLGWGSYVLCKCVKYLWVYTAGMNLTFSRRSALHAVLQIDRCDMQRNTVRFPLGTATYLETYKQD